MKKIIFILSAFLMQYLYAQENADAAKSLVQKQAETILTQLNQNQALYAQDQKAFAKMVEKEILPHMDFEMMTRVVLGKHWGQMNAAQQKDFMAAFQDFLVRAYSKGWQQYTGIQAQEALTFLNQPQVDAKQRTQLKLQVRDKHGKKNSVNFSLRYKNGQWKIYDVEFENISFLLSYRGTFDQVIQQNGVEHLIQQLKEGRLKE